MKQDESTRIQIAVYRPKVELIQKVIGQHFDISIHKMQSHDRTRPVVRARRFTSYFVREFAVNCPLKVMGILIGNGKEFHHATLIHACHMMNDEMQMRTRTGELVYPEISEEVKKIRKKIEKELAKNGGKVMRLTALRARKLKYHYRALVRKAYK